MPALLALPCLHTLDVDEELLGDFQAALPGKGWDRETEKGCWRQGVKARRRVSVWTRTWGLFVPLWCLMDCEWPAYLLRCWRLC